jgi:ABC-2 type transport system ATP-binding protein
VPDAIELVDLHHAYGRTASLNGLSLTVRQGELYGLLGRNGAGKTTTLRVLMGLLRPKSGTVRLLGEVVKKVSLPLKRRIGYVSQEQHFYPWMTATDLGRFVAGLYPTWDAAEFTRLLKALDVPPARRASELSGGTRTKLGLALALAPRPELLLLDEPTTGLDPVARAEFNELAVETVKQRGTTAFLSSHLVDEVEHIATRVGILNAGRMRLEGDVATLLASVRRVLSPMPLALPVGFTQVRGEVWHAAPEHWASMPWPEGTSVEPLSLADLFLAYARTDVSAAP